jgi:hypothetical protein
MAHQNTVFEVYAASGWAQKKRKRRGGTTHLTEVQVVVLQRLKILQGSTLDHKVRCVDTLGEMTVQSVQVAKHRTGWYMKLGVAHHCPTCTISTASSSSGFPAYLRSRSNNSRSRIVSCVTWFNNLNRPEESRMAQYQRICMRIYIVNMQRDGDGKPGREEVSDVVVMWCQQLDSMSRH